MIEKEEVYNIMGLSSKEDETWSSEEEFISSHSARYDKILSSAEEFISSHDECNVPYVKPEYLKLEPALRDIFTEMDSKNVGCDKS